MRPDHHRVQRTTDAAAHRAIGLQRCGNGRCVAAMTASARRYTVGTDEVERLDVTAGMASGLGKQQLLWIDADADAAALEAVDDALDLDRIATTLPNLERPSVRFLDGAIRLTVIGLTAADAPERPTPVLVHILAAPNAVVTIHDRAVLGLADPVAAVEGDPRFGDLDAGSFVGLLLDGIIGGHFEELEAIEREVDAIDERALRREPTDVVLDALVDLRRRIGVLRRSLAAQREVYATLARPIGDQGSPIGAPWPAITERLERAIDATERARELLVGSFDIVMTRTGQRTNDVMRVLTVISSVLLPSVVIAGAMGMNFHPAFFDDPTLFYVVVAVMLGLGALVLVAARTRRWL